MKQETIPLPLNNNKITFLSNLDQNFG